MSAGLSDYVRPAEDIEVAVSNLYNRIAHPVLTDLEVDFGCAEVDDVYPPAIPELFAGHQVVLAGRFANPIESEVTMNGVSGGASRSYRFREDFSSAVTSDTEDNDFIPQLWATRQARLSANTGQVKPQRQSEKASSGGRVRGWWRYREPCMAKSRAGPGQPRSPSRGACRAPPEPFWLTSHRLQ